jgi:hypothetical protein
MCATRAKRDRPVPDTAKWDRPERDGPSALHGCDGSHAAWAVQVLYEAASAEKVGLMLDSGLLPGLEYVRVPTPSHPRVCAGVVGGAILFAVQRRRRRHLPVRLQAKHAESLAVAVKVARVLTRLCEQVTHACTHERTLSHTHTRTLSHTRTRTNAHASAHMHTPAHTRTQAHSGRQARL